MAYTDTWNAAFEASPADIDNISEGAERIRDTKLGVRERLSKDHYMDIAGTDADHGEHSKCTLRKQTSKPTAEADKGYIYTKIIGPHVELFYENEAGTEIQLTVLGALPTALPAGVTTGGVAVHSGVGTAFQELSTNSGASAIEWFTGFRKLFTAAGDTGYASAANTLARLAIGSANYKKFVNAAGTAPEWAEGLIVKTFTRSLSATVGDVAYTDAGFKPSVVIMVGSRGTSGSGFTCGFYDGTTHTCFGQFGGTGAYNTRILSFYDGGYGQSALVKSLDSDGCTLTWVKDNAYHSTTAYCGILYIR
jgi:hypothetical protein